MGSEQQIYHKNLLVFDLARKNKCEIEAGSSTFQIKKNNESIAAFETIDEVFAFFVGYALKGKKKK